MFGGVDALYYDLLDLTKNCYESDIKKRFRLLSIRFHPQKNPNNKDAEKRFSSICEAYEVLNNTRMRSCYDRYGKRGLLWDFGGWSPSSPFTVFRSFFEEHGGHDIIMKYLQSPGHHNSKPTDWSQLIDKLEEVQKLNELLSNPNQKEYDVWEGQSSMPTNTNAGPLRPSGDLFTQFRSMLKEDPITAQSETTNNTSPRAKKRGSQPNFEEIKSTNTPSSLRASRDVSPAVDSLDMYQQEFAVRPVSRSALRSSQHNTPTTTTPTYSLKNTSPTPNSIVRPTSAARSKVRDINSNQVLDQFLAESCPPPNRANKLASLSIPAASRHIDTQS